MIDLSSWKNKEIKDWEKILMPSFDYPELVRIYENNILQHGAIIMSIDIRFKRLDKLEEDEETITLNGSISLERAKIEEV